MFDIEFIESALKIQPIKIGRPKKKEFTGFEIDSRQCGKDRCFIGIKGENHDGNDFAPELSQKGVRFFILEKDKAKSLMERIEAGYVFVVENSVKALATLARAHKEQIFAPVVAVTGSSGKTTTRHLITAVLSEKFDVHTARKNFNTEIGLPLSMLDAPTKTHLMVLEMGMNHRGEIGRLSSIAEPLCAVVTNVGYAHVGILGSLSAIADAKSEIYYGINKRGFVFLNRDDDYFDYFKEKSPVEVKSFGNNDIEILENRGMNGFRLRYEEREFNFKLPGLYNVNNLSAAFKVGEFFRVSIDDRVAAAEKFEPVSGRSNSIEGKSVTIIDDCYNANPSSMMAALSMLKMTSGKRRIAVLSDMLELGDLSESLHQVVGSYLSENECADAVFAYGSESRKMLEAIDGKIPAYWFENIQELEKAVRNFAEKGDVVLVKASRGMHLEKIVESLK